MTYTGSSCEDIYNNNPETGGKSGYYRINDKWTYCNMKEISSTTKSTTIIMSTSISIPTTTPKITPTISGGEFVTKCAGVGGGWRRIVNINISAGDNCPSGWRTDSYNGISFCRVVSDFIYTCSSANFSTSGTSYQRVCGRARGYQKGHSASFWGYHNHYIPSWRTIDGEYVEGLSLTYGNPRHHIWTYANGRLDNPKHPYNCPCDGGLPPPPFVGTNYYCESGAADKRNDSAYYFNDPLWDGSGCIKSNCCDNPTQPWFYRELNETTTSDIEARICRVDRFSVGSTLIDQLEIYIQ